MIDSAYKKKLELSYLKCLDELCNPDDWEEIIQSTKFVMNPNTGLLRTSHDFILNKSDIVEISEVNHTYSFKRSHFYLTFLKGSSRLKRDVIKCWRERKYYVDIIQEGNIWKLRISW